MHLNLEVENNLIWREKNPQSYGFRIADAMEYVPTDSNQLSLNGNAADVRQIVDKADTRVGSAPGDVPGEYTILLDYKASASTPASEIVEDIPCHPGWRNNGDGPGV